MDEELNNENIAALNQSLSDLQTLMRQQTGLLRQQNQLAFLQLNATQRAQINLDEFGRTVAEDDRVLEAHIKQVELTNQRIAAMRGAFDNATMGAKSLFNALTEASGGVAKYKGVLDGIGGVFDSLIKGFGPSNQAFNLGLQAAAKALFGLSGLVLEQTQYMIKSMDTVAGMGVTSSITSNQLRLLGEKAGYSWTNLEKFAAITAKAGRDLLVFGGSTAAGVAAFTRFTAIGDDQYKKYRALGFEQEQVTELMRDLVSVQIRSGGATGRGANAMDRLQGSTLKLIDNMLALANITGLSVEEQKKGLDYAAQNANLRVFRAQENIRAREIEARGTPEAIAEAAIIRQRAQAKLEIGGLITSEFGEKIATGFLQRAASERTGALTEESAPLELLLSKQGGLTKFLDAINQATTQEDLDKARNNLRAALLISTQEKIQSARSLQGLGAAQTEYLETFGVFAAGIDTTVANFNNRTEESVEKLGQNLSNQVQSEIAKLSALTDAQGKFVGKANDNIMNAAAAIASFERYATLQLATIVASMNPLIGNSGKAAAKLIAVSVAAGAAAAALTYFAYKLIRTPTTPAPVPGAPTTGGSGTIERRRDRRGRDYYVDTATGRRVSREQGEAAEAARTRGRFRFRPGTALRGVGGIATSLAAPYLIDAVGGEGTTGGALANIGLQTAGMAATGSMFGPLGTLFGGALGLGTGLYQSGGTLLNNLFGGGGGSGGNAASDITEQAEDAHEENLEMLEEQLGLGKDQVDELQKSANIAFLQLQELTKIGNGITEIGETGFGGAGGDISQGGPRATTYDEQGRGLIDHLGNRTQLGLETKALTQSQESMMRADPIERARMEKEYAEYQAGTRKAEDLSNLDDFANFYERTTGQKLSQQELLRMGTPDDPNFVATRNQRLETLRKGALDAGSGSMAYRSYARDYGDPNIERWSGSYAANREGEQLAGGVPQYTGAVRPMSPQQFQYVTTDGNQGQGVTGQGTFGELKPGQVDLTNVTSKSGASASVDKKFQRQFQGLIDELEQSGYKISRIDGYNNRKIAGSNQWSSHAYGAAIDINPLQNMPGQAGDLPFNAGQIASKYGLGWGATFRSNPDPMHFSATAREGGSFQARYGAMLEGPMSGYNPNITFHGNEIISPAPRDSILQKYFTETATEGNRPLAQADIEGLMNTQNNTFRELIRIQNEQYNKQQTVVDKLQTIAETLQSSQSTQSEILRYTRS